MGKRYLFAIPVAACMFAGHLSSADFWQSKPFTEWNEKDVQKLLQSSPWARPVSVAASGAAASAANASPLDGFSGLGNRKGVNPGDSSGARSLVTVVVRWQSAKPVRQAAVKAKYGNEAGTSPEAKKALDEPSDHYIISICGLPANAFDGNPDHLRQQMLAQGMLVIKGREPIRPVDFITEGDGPTAQGMFVFPKTILITEDDKDAEFIVKIRDYNIRQKFHLKDMVYNGQLDL
jgi:hypothetical protein